MKPDYLRHILTVGSGGATAQALTVITMPIITRLYSPEAYAGWALLMSVVIIFTSIATLRYELAVVLPSTHEEAANVMGVCFFVTGTIAALAALLVPVSGTWLLGEGFYGELRLWLWYVPPLIVATGIYQACNSWCTRTLEFRWYSLAQVALPLLTISAQIAAAFLGWRSSSGLITGTLVGQFSALLLLLVLISRKYGTLMTQALSQERFKQSFFKYKVYPFYMTPYTLIGTIRDRLVYFLLANFGGKSGVGFYNLSSRLANMPNSLLSSAIRPVFFQKAASTDFKSLEGVINRALRALTICVIPFWILFLFQAKTLFALVFGEPWREAGLYAAILSVPAIPLLLGNWLDRSFDVLGRQRLAFALEAIFSVISVGVLTLGIVAFKSALLGISLQAGALTLYYSYWLYALFRAAGFARGGLLKLILLASSIGLLFAGFVWFLSSSLSILPAVTIAGSTAAIGVSAYLLRQWRDLKLE
jgi:O-antigen/teichoic acid export membrane protein